MSRSALLSAALWCVAAASSPLLGEVLVRVGPELQVNTFTTSDQMLAALAAGSDGRFVVAWQSYGEDGSHWSVFARRFDSAGAALGGEFAVNSFTTGYQDRKGVTVDAAGNFVIVWGSSFQDGNAAGVFGRRYDSGGAALGFEFQVNVQTIGIQHVPVVAAEDNGDFVVAWRSFAQDGDDYGIFARRFDSAGAPKASEFKVNTFTAGRQDYQAIASDADGDFVVVWGSAGQDGDGKGVFGRRFDSAGTPLGAEFQVNSYTLGSEYRPAVGIDDNGDLVIAWTSSAQDGSGNAAFARRFNSTGALQGLEFQVSTVTLGGQAEPSVALDSDGDFVIVWSSAGQDSSGSGVFARSFTAAGVALANEFQVNTVVTGGQYVPAVSIPSDGAAVIAWQSSPGGPSAVDVRAQRLGLAVPLDIDGNGATDPLTDGLLFLRFRFGFIGTTLTGGAVAGNCTRCDGAAIAAYVDGLNFIMDIDGDGSLGALTDGLLVLRYLFGFTGATLTNGAVSGSCSRCDASTIAPFLQGLDL